MLCIATFLAFILFPFVSASIQLLVTSCELLENVSLSDSIFVFHTSNNSLCSLLIFSYCS